MLFTLQPDSKGKYVFDIGCQQHGTYFGIEQPDEKAEEEEAAPTLIPKWKAGEITEIKLEPEDDDLVGEAGDAPAAAEETPAGKNSSYNRRENYCMRISELCCRLRTLVC